MGVRAARFATPPVDVPVLEPDTARERRRGWNDHIANDLTASLTDAISSGYLTSEDAGYAVAVKARDQGMGSLTTLEQDIFEFELRPLIESFEQRKIEDMGRDELERQE